MLMKRLIFLLFCSLMLSMTGCNEAELQEPTANEYPIEHYDFHQKDIQITKDINITEINNILNDILGSSVKSRNANYNLSILKDSIGEPAVIVINCDGGGYALISAKKDYQPLLAYNTEGHFNIGSKMHPIAYNWLINTISDVSKSSNLPQDSLITIHNLWRRFENMSDNVISRTAFLPHDRLYDISPSEYERLKGIFQDSINNWKKQGYRVYPIDEYPGTTGFGDDLPEFMQGRVYPYYSTDYWAISFIVEKDYKYRNGRAHNLETCWDQINNFNMSYPILKSGRYAVAGCVPVAIGQIMYDHKYPSNINWGGMPKGSVGNKTVSDFLYQIALKGEATFIENRTSIKLSKIIPILNSYGYSVKTSSDFNNLALYNNILVYSKLDGNGHLWIIEGSETDNFKTEYEIWSFTSEDVFECISGGDVSQTYIQLYYANWGWGGDCNGYFGNIRNLIPNGYSSHQLEKYF